MRAIDPARIASARKGPSVPELHEFGPHDRITLYSIRDNPRTGTIEGYTETQKSVAQLLARLAVLPELSSVQLKSSMEADFQGQTVVQFVIAANVKAVTGATA